MCDESPSSINLVLRNSGSHTPSDSPKIKSEYVLFRSVLTFKAHSGNRVPSA
uniref:Uncharacterized protein n=1 Tax=Anguilla anguilla TaxID=7936 RepID=A0A0E9QG21_ANGAN